jgi:hypothetical protein
MGPYLYQTIKVESKGKVLPSSNLSLTLALDKGGWSTPRPGRITPGKETRYPFIGGWVAPGPVWTAAENLVPTGIRSPNRPARSESLYQLRYSGPRSNARFGSFLIMKPLKRTNDVIIKITTKRYSL